LPQPKLRPAGVETALLAYYRLFLSLFSRAFCPAGERLPGLAATSAAPLDIPSALALSGGPLDGYNRVGRRRGCARLTRQL